MNNSRRVGVRTKHDSIAANTGIPGMTLGVALSDGTSLGLAAGMATIAAAYGYITEDDDPREWGADILASDTEELAQIVRKAVNLEGR